MLSDKLTPSSLSSSVSANQQLVIKEKFCAHSASPEASKDTSSSSTREVSGRARLSLVTVVSLSFPTFMSGRARLSFARLSLMTFIGCSSSSSTLVVSGRARLSLMTVACLALELT